MRPQPVLASVLAKAALAGVVSQPGRALAKSNECGFITAAAIRGTEMKVVYRILPLIAPAVAVGASVALGEPNASAFSYAASGACLASPEGFNSKLEPNNSGVAWTTIFTSSGSANSHGNATEVGQGINSASFGVGPRMHMPAAYAYRIQRPVSARGPYSPGSFQTTRSGRLSWTTSSKDRSRGSLTWTKPKAVLPANATKAILRRAWNAGGNTRNNLEKLEKMPLLFIMMNTTEEAEDVGDWLRHKYPAEFGGDKRVLVIHTDKTGEITKKDLDAARKLAREVDSPDCPTRAIVSVLMLREGWDVQNVTVVVGLRPYTSSANILPEQAIGRGLRLMFRGQNYAERVDIIGNKAFISFVDDLEKLEDIKLDTFEVGKDKLKIIAIAPQLPEKADYDLSLPRLSPVLVRKKTLAEEIGYAGCDGLQVQSRPPCLESPPTQISGNFSIKHSIS